jgi:hypothetical protein
MISLFLILALIYQLAASPTKYYRSRLQWNYFPQSIDVYFALFDDENVEPNIKSLSWLMETFEVVLPCCGTDLQDPDEREAHLEALRSRNELLRKALSSGIYHKIRREPELSRRFVYAIVDNLLGNKDELLKPELKADDNDKTFEEPAYRTCTQGYLGILSKLYANSNIGMSIFEKLYERKFLATLAALLHSPDERERISTVQIFIGIGTRLLPAVDDLWDDDKVICQGAIKAIAGILQSGYVDIRDKLDSISLRSFEGLTVLLFKLLKSSSGTEFESTFQNIFLRSVIPLFGRPGCHKYHEYLNDILRKQFQIVRDSGNLQYWSAISAQFTKHMPHGSWDDENDEKRLDTIWGLFLCGSIIPEYHVDLIDKLLSHVQNSDHHLTQLSVLDFLATPECRRFFSTLSPIYNNETLRLCVLRELLWRLFHWYLSAPDNPQVRSALRRTSEVWLNSEESKKIQRVDPSYSKLADTIEYNIMHGELVSGMASINVDKRHCIVVPQDRE